MVALMRFLRRYLRILRVEYALSASTRSGLVRGLRPQRRLMQISANDRGERERIVALPGAGDPADRPAPGVCDEVDLRAQSAPAAPERLPVLDRFSSPAPILVVRPIPLCPSGSDCVLQHGRRGRAEPIKDRETLGRSRGGLS